MLVSQNAKPKSQNHNSKFKSDIKLRAYKFSIAIIEFIVAFPNKKTFWILGDQLLRSATSIGANIVEAKCSSSKREFSRYYEIALKSSNETCYWLCLLRDTSLSKETDQKQLKKILDEAVEISKILGSSLLTLKGKRKI